MGPARLWERQSIFENGVIETAKQGWGQVQGGRGRGAVNRAEVSSCGRAVSCGSSDPQWWRTELELSSGESFDDRHRSAALGGKAKAGPIPGWSRLPVLSGMELCPVLRSIEAGAWSVAGWQGSRSDGHERSPWGADGVGSGARTHRAIRSSVFVHCCEQSHANER